MISVFFINFSRKSILICLLTLLSGFSCKKEEASVDSNSPANPVSTGFLPDTGQIASYTTIRGEDSDFSYHSPASSQD